jgi:hypothetical protein
VLFTTPVSRWVAWKKVFGQLKVVMSNGVMNQQVFHPMVKFQRKIQSLVTSGVVKSTDSIWKIALLFGDDWSYWKQELEDFDFSLQDPIDDLLAVEDWDDDAL